MKRRAHKALLARIPAIDPALYFLRPAFPLTNPVPQDLPVHVSVVNMHRGRA
jgi:hypothetical protein